MRENYGRHSRTVSQLSPKRIARPGRGLIANTHTYSRDQTHTHVLPLATYRVLLSHITVPLSLTLHLAPPPHGAARPEHTGQRSRLTICRTYKEEREPYTVALPVALS